MNQYILIYDVKNRLSQLSYGEGKFFKDVSYKFFAENEKQACKIAKQYICDFGDAEYRNIELQLLFSKIKFPKSAVVNASDDIKIIFEEG